MYKTLSLFLLALIPLSLNATVVGFHTTAQGKVADLSGLEWLEVTPTLGISREDIEAGSGGFLDAGYLKQHGKTI